MNANRGKFGKGGNDARLDFAGCSARSFIGSITVMAVQSRVGLLPEWFIRRNPRYRFDLAIAGSLLSPQKQ
jgi:hypothetical protein